MNKTFDHTANSFNKQAYDTKMENKDEKEAKRPGSSVKY